MARKDVSKLRDEAAKAVERGKLDRAIEIYEELEAAEPKAPTWPKRIGETHRRNGNNARAVTAFERAAEKYVLEGFLVQAIAVCKLILQIDPAHSAAQARLAELMPARAKRKTTRSVPMDGTTQALPIDPMRATQATPTDPMRATQPIDPMRATQPIDPMRATQPIDPMRATQAMPIDPMRATQPIDPMRATQPIDPMRATQPVDPVRATQPVPIEPPAPSATPARPNAIPPKHPTPTPRPPVTPVGTGAIPLPPKQRIPIATPPRSVDPRPPPEPPPAPPSEQRLPRPVRGAPEPSVPAIIVDRAAAKIEIPPGSGLDAIDFSTLIPGAQAQFRPDGTLSGVHVLPLDDDLELSIDEDLELSLDDAEITTEPVDRRPGPAARRALLTTPLFPAVPPRVLETLIARMSLIELAENEVLFREGETGHELFVVSEGEVAVESAGVGELARLGPSAFFGEIALVTDLPRSATIRAVTRVELLAMNRDVLRDALAEHPEILTVMLRFVRDRLIDRITRTSELFQPFTELERVELSKKFELVEVVPDAMLITQGERADGLYLIVAGKVEVQPTGEPVIATLSSGDVFGELSLLAGGGSTANVRSVTRVLALRMPASTFQEVIMTHPQVLAYLGELAERRTPRAQADDFIDLHLDMLV